MKTTKNSRCLSLFCGCLFAVAANGQTMIENLQECASDADLLAAWSASIATLSLSPYVAPGSADTNSLRVDVSFPATDWQTEVLTGPALPAPMSISPTQYITLRVAGDPQFTNATYQTLFVYAFDGSGNFGRWGSSFPTSTTNWPIPGGQSKGFFQLAYTP